MGSADLGLDMALVALSVAFPAGAAPVTAHLGGWFTRSERPLRTALALALGVHGLAGRAAEQIIWDQVGESVRWVRRSRKFTAYVPSDSPFPKPDQEPYINSPVPEAIQVAGRLRAGAEEQTSDFASVFSFLITLMESGGHLIEGPADADLTQAPQIDHSQAPRPTAAIYGKNVPNGGYTFACLTQTNYAP